MNFGVFGSAQTCGVGGFASNYGGSFKATGSLSLGHTVVGLYSSGENEDVVNEAIGVWGDASASGATGVYGRNALGTNGVGVYGYAGVSGGIGVAGSAHNAVGTGVYGSASVYGIFGTAGGSGMGVLGRAMSVDGIGVVGTGSLAGVACSGVFRYAVPAGYSAGTYAAAACNTAIAFYWPTVGTVWINASVNP